jgi:hypothetical protein
MDVLETYYELVCLQYYDVIVLVNLKALKFR